jgi:DNA-binding beta-propeller fold protein YncE
LTKLRKIYTIPCLNNLVMKADSLKAVTLLGLFTGLISGNVSADASNLYVTDSDSQSLYTLSTVNGAPTLVGGFGVLSPGTIADLAYDANDNILYATTSDTGYLCSINRNTGIVTTIGWMGAFLMHGLAYDNATGVLYGASTANGGNGGLYRINTISAQATFIGDIGVNVGGDWVDGLAFNPANGVLYGCISGPDYLGGLVTINTATGQGTLIAGTQALTDIDFQPETDILYGIDNGIGLYPDGLYTINPFTGQATLVGYTGLGNELGLAFAPVPEPGSVVLAGVAALSCLMSWRRNQKSKQ